jgi:hypothetical protein
MKLLSLALVTVLTAGCATTSMPEQQEALAGIGIASAIERTQDPERTARIVLEIATAPLAVDSVSPEIKARIGYTKLPASQQLAVDAVLAELNRQLATALTTADKDATLALWRRAAIAAASRFVRAPQ